MTTSGFPSARKKLKRALFHADALRTAVDSFRNQSPYEFEMKSLGNPQGHSDIRINVKVSQAPPVPDSWPLITGDILTVLSLYTPAVGGSIPSAPTKR